MRLLIRGALLLTMKEKEEPFSGDLLIEQDRIAASDMVAMPGLINAHNLRR